MDRDDFNGGPAYFVHDGVTWQVTNDDFEAASEIVTIPVKSNLQGTLGQREDYSMTTVKATPIAFTSSLAAMLAKLFAFTPTNIGAMLFASTNKPFVIQTKAGKSSTWSTGGLLQPPEVQFRAGQPLFSGDAEWLMLRKNNTDASDAAAHVVVATSAYTEPVLDPVNIVNSRYAFNWGEDDPFLAIELDEDGFKFSVKYEWEDLQAWNDGLLNKRLKDVTASGNFSPVSLDEADFLNTMLILDGAGAGRGNFLSARGLELTITGAAEGDPLLTIPCAAAVKGSTRYGSKSRVGGVEMQAQRVYASGLQPLFTLGVVPEA